MLFSPFYNSEIWHIPKAKSQTKITVNVGSRFKTNYNDPIISFERFHDLNKRATPEKMMLYKHALLLNKMYTSPCYFLYLRPIFVINSRNNSTSKYKQFLTLNVHFFSWELQVKLRVQFNAKQSSKPKRDFPSAT